MGASPLLREVLAEAVEVSATELLVVLTDGRRLTVPLAWFPTIATAPEAQRAHWELIGDGEGVHWPDLDADVSVEGLLYGIPER